MIKEYFHLAVLKKSLLITGGAGFIGSNFIKYWSKKYPTDQILVIDKLTYAGNINNILDLINKKKVIFKEGDICDSFLIKEILEENNISYLVNFAAETHVDSSIKNPEYFIRTNINGTYNLLNSFKFHWEKKNKPESMRFLQISTDEVFGSLSLTDPPFTEKSPHKPRSPYSASKSSGDHLSKAWFHTYGIPILISNCSNNYGPYHYPEKLIPLTITNILRNKSIKIYGDGKNIRDWLFVNDHCSALDKILIYGKAGSNYCIGGDNEISNIDLVNIICEIIDSKEIIKTNSSSKNLISFVRDRPGHDLRYSINSTKLKKDFNWEPEVKLKDGLEDTIKWYLDNKNWWQPLIKKNEN